MRRLTKKIEFEGEGLDLPTKFKLQINDHQNHIIRSKNL